MLQSRCNDILESLGLGRVRHHHGWEDSARLETGAVREVALVPATDGTVILKLYPGDSVAQAREFYANVDTKRFLGLPQLGWSIRPNLHFAFIQKNIYWPKAQVSIERYLSFWLEKSAIIQKWDREFFNELFCRLKIVGQLLQDDVDELRRVYMDSNRNSLNLCPGFEALYRWPVDEASTYEDEGVFEVRVREKIVEAFDTWAQSALSEVTAE